MENLELALKINTHETFLKNQLTVEKYNEVLQEYKKLLVTVHKNLKEKLKPEADYIYTARWICLDIDNDSNIEYSQKPYQKAFFSLAAFYLQSENKA